MSRGQDKGTKVPASKLRSKSSAQSLQAPRSFPGVSMETYAELAERTRLVTQTHIREE